ncbi:hypothetical protein [Pseudobacteriovorax antillogorgiicola]|uniref:Uncharacterized protein n=1 Tax=Pseudobacteriovorax antillogorgiicola TaxID=1513793 RepID=A0A1Y6BIV5_9BACT|nr:hypothetical protein [Pseudobacteriovorax antillogorgiicola]TCS57279.1 hypothetical protein EDD56_10319 [Pseudobacteriovorax antillogorgiicola]SMF03136.1 hypothetical protein SAMN06296036_103314 [Pseudobacteriovorax antillogorgiicola]
MRLIVGLALTLIIIAAVGAWYEPVNHSESITSIERDGVHSVSKPLKTYEKQHSSRKLIESRLPSARDLEPEVTDNAADEGWDRMAQVLKDTPFLGQNFRMSHKAIMSPSDWSLWAHELSDYKNIQSAFQVLRQLDKEIEVNVAVRIEYINYIHRAIALEGNPIIDQLIDELVQFLQFRPVDYESYSTGQKRVFVGDKIELIYILEAYFPETYQARVRNGSSDTLVRLAIYAEENRQLLNRIF